MGQLVKNLRNVRRYRDVFKTSDLSQNIAAAFDIKDKKRIDVLQKLLSYDGAGEIKVPGAFLSIIPEITSLPVAHIADLLDISKSTYYRAKEEDMLEMEIVDRMSSLLKIYHRGLEAFEDDKGDFSHWLNTRISSLGDREPLKLLKTENGRLAVLDAIDRIEHSVYG